MSGHTPGPWEIRRPSYGQGFTREIWGADGKCVTGMTTRMTTGPVTEANARLIAAAPDMLEALEGMVEMATHHMMEPEERRERLRNARAAIAKARGQA